jgi:hypothetical protein
MTSGEYRQRHVFHDHQLARHHRVQQPVHAAVQIKDMRRFLDASPH